MSVVGSGSKLLFCEGKPNSLDVEIFKRLVVTPTTIIPAGGKRGLGAFAEGRLSSLKEVDRPPYFVVRDRDFDAEPPSSSIQMIAPFVNKPVFLTYRACIENYLLDASLIDSYWSENYEQSPKWRHGASPGAVALRDWINQSAESIRDYQAVRWALAKLKPSDRWPEAGTTWTQGSGYLPDSLEIDFCLEQAKQLVNTFNLECSGVTETNLDRYLAAFRERFRQDDFWSQEQHLIWFHGKDLKKAMQKNWQNTISLSSFCSWATQKLNISIHPDLIELQNRLQQL